MASLGIPGRDSSLRTFPALGGMREIDGRVADLGRV